MNKNISITLNITRVFSHSYAQKLFYTVESPLEKKHKIWSFHFQTIPDDLATNLLNECY